ncbi:hypothetical protein BHU72_08150 [Desulfuribacillus stibiiarsenatis]|uniref:DNA mismatch repair protein MutL n=1 Tax=Desulfuribacillus stibiiarsenatis TaxID=1390249 RepID=A0A1E5L3X6_9FIRM|nr:DNA mismatch repair endonuclease MutL [Desulfuribacillus stibiiarsenatis]OEH84796.1 hypothetical protein BHU72_08150 [Desulfuribacillus stibiiarsenatis]
MSIIHILEDHIANQIAAGEVIERPMSVVKELVENSIDAKSTRIKIELLQAGLELIRVLDNGAGMDSSDAQLCFQRHATSKIRNTRDLFKISTLGFRGEALPSIAAISKVEVKTRTQQETIGSHIRIEGNQSLKYEPIGCPIGTEISVKSLFYNTPARLKYLKSLTTEIGHISEYISRIALAHTHISFELWHNGKQILQTFGDQNIYSTVLRVYGAPTNQQWISIKNENMDYAISGIISKPELNRANRQHITFFVNGRYVRSTKLADSIIHAYHTLLPINRFPITILNIDMDYTLVDVNVHPSKLEVRFSKEEELKEFLYETIHKNLMNQSLIPKILADKKHSSIVSQYNQPLVHKKIDLVKEKSKNLQLTLNPSENVLNEFQYKPINKSVEQNQPLIEAKTIEIKPKETFRVIGQFHGTYILAENENGLYIIDQHAAHERINYERFLNRLRNYQFKKQDLLIPISLTYSITELTIIQEKKELIEKFGINFESFGSQTIVIREYPDWIPHDSIQTYISFIFDSMILREKEIDVIELQEDACIQLSCKMSIKANQRISIEETNQLLEDLMNTSLPYTCPHGRPIIIHYSVYELEKLFKRKN